MTFARHLLVASLPLLLVACGGQEGGGGGGSTKRLDDAALSERVVGYYKRVVTTPGLTLNVRGMTDSELPGWRKGTLEAKLGDDGQDVPFYVTQDGRYFFRGEVIDLTSDPFKLLMNKIKLDGAPMRGPKDAKVTIVEYSDFQCPFCSKAYETVETQVLKEYGDKVRFVFKNFPLFKIHPWALPAAIASECAYQQSNDGFWAMYNGLFRNQAEMTADNVNDKALEIGKAAGLDEAKLKDCLDNKKGEDAVKADQSEAMAIGVNSTPTFFVNGHKLNGAESFDAFKKVIDDELGKTG
jgi:protein-disulfide isomerase